MTFQSLEQVGLIEHYRVAKDEIRHVLKLARRDMKTARELMNINLDWALIAAYNAALQTGLAVMYTKGYRPKEHDWHKNVILMMSRQVIFQKYLQPLSVFAKRFTK